MLSVQIWIFVIVACLLNFCILYVFSLKVKAFLELYKDIWGTWKADWGGGNFSSITEFEKRQ